MIYLLPIPICVMWLIGGQINKAVRRFGAPGLATLVLVWKLLHDKKKENDKHWPAYILILVYMGLLSVGYGVNSHLMKWLKSDLTVRLAYGIILSIPLWIFTLITHNTPVWHMIPVTAALIGAFQVRAGVLARIGKYEVLIEDIIRSLTFGYSLVWIMLPR